jgi:pimeloyl-ACP methyl ester carboxylesterase
MHRSRPRWLRPFLTSLAIAAASVAAAQPAVPPRPGAGGYDAEGFIPIPDTNLAMYFFVVGEGDPDLIVFSSPFLDGELLPLADGRTIAFVHSRGRGNSTTVADTSTVSYETELADIDTARAYFGLDRMNLAGTSLWGGLAGLYAARHPDRVDRLLLLNPVPPRASWMAEPANLPENDEVAARAALGRLQAANADQNDVYAFCRQELVLLSVATVYDLANLENRRSDPCQYRNEHLAVSDPLIGALFESVGDWDWRDELTGVQATTLVVHGSHDLAAAGAFEEWAATIPDATVVRVDEAGHETLLDRPDVVLSLLAPFLDGEMP